MANSASGCAVGIRQRIRATVGARVALEPAARERGKRRREGGGRHPLAQCGTQEAACGLVGDHHTGAAQDRPSQKGVVEELRVGATDTRLHIKSTGSGAGCVVPECVEAKDKSTGTRVDATTLRQEFVDEVAKG